MEKETKKNWQEILREKYEQQILAWKKQHGTVKVLFVEDDKEFGRALFFRIPTRLQLAASEAVSVSAVGDVDAFKKSERLLADCLLGGDISEEDILNDATLFVSVGKFILYELVGQKKTNWEIC